jgi:hypothetical protein
MVWDFATKIFAAYVILSRPNKVATSDPNTAPHWMYIVLCTPHTVWAWAGQGGTGIRKKDLRPIYLFYTLFLDYVTNYVTVGNIPYIVISPMFSRRSGPSLLI